ncbi:hypothetical protein ABZY44_19030 [Streptomyces sp. NPDC006544]|uniref:hypothetical protein n=1 Tax=Streptomyces sp. NPDC006544 TaxID=3154583 RepID=UPI0033B55793
MITEPEFDGSWSGPRESPWEGPRRPEPTGPADPPAGPAGSPAPAAKHADARRPWRWALGGALAASALWAGAGWALAPQDDRPPLRYAVPVSLCVDAKLPVLARLGGVRGWEFTPSRWEHPGVDQALCMLRTPPLGAKSTASAPGSEPASAPALSYEVQVSVALHKLTDPAPEFGADPGTAGWLGTGSSSPRSVPGLGERALISESDYGKWWRLTVLDGGAVFTLHVTAWTDGAGEPAGSGAAVGTGPPAAPPEPDADAIQAAMIDDMHTLMKDLRR